ncbi:MAG: RloB domain-containing protein, partial [Myxococcales bacterium]|nr:RloB domain-containing protein [Myxococcales bacterium]
MVSKRRNDDRDYRRRPPKRDPKFRILVVCEGELTEPEYLKAFRHAVRNQRVHVELADEHGVPLTVVETAVRVAQEAADRAEQEADDNLRFDSVWAVFDVDEHPSTRSTDPINRCSSERASRERRRCGRGPEDAREVRSWISPSSRPSYAR